MGVGFIQLIATGNEYLIFNREPQISFFKIYYRRHTNFFVNNFEINGNYIKTNSIITYNVPKNGDLLSKTYLKCLIDENYVELFNEYSSLYSSLNIDLLNLYDSYDIQTNSYNKDKIENISVIKTRFYVGETNYISIMVTNIINPVNMLEIVKNTPGLYLETDSENLFYNINKFYNFYGFKMETENKSYLSNTFALYLLNQIDNTKIEYIRFDIFNYNLSFKVRFTEDSANQYQEIIQYILLNANDTDDVLNIKIDQYQIYFGIKYGSINNSLSTSLSSLFDLLFGNTKLVNLTIIDNKIKETNTKIPSESIDSLKKIFFNINTNNYVYYYIDQSVEITSLTMYILKNSTFFGNLTPNDYNECLIQNETTFINNTNLFDTKLPTNFYIRTLVSLICSNKISIQEYLKIISYTDFIIKNKIDSYNSDLYSFNNKIFDIIMNEKVLLLSKDTFKRIIYQNEIRNNYGLINKILPFANRKITIYQNILLNFYLYYDILDKFANKYNQTYNSQNSLLADMIYISKINYFNIESNSSTKIYFRNYLYNNNLFQFVLSGTGEKNISDNTFLLKNSNPSEILDLQKRIIDNLVVNTILTIITEIIDLFTFIYNKKSEFIYAPSGQLTSLFYETNLSTCFYPLSSSIFLSIGTLKDECPPENNYTVPSSIDIFNRKIENYQNNIYENVKNEIEYNFSKVKTNYNDEINVKPSNIFNNVLLGDKLNTIINDYYKNNVINQNEFDQLIFKEFLNQNILGNYGSIYSATSPDLNDFIMKYIFIYADSIIYNGAFSNFEFETKVCGDPPVMTTTNFIQEKNYNKFLFLINSPIYRIYFLFTYFAFMTLDQSIIGALPNDFIVLRDFTIKFVTAFLSFFNNVNLSQLDSLFSQTQNYILDPIKNKNLSIDNQYLCFDPIDIFTNEYFNYLISLNTDNKFLYIYNSFYFQKKQNEYYTVDASNNRVNTVIIESFVDEVLYNFDDKIIILFLNTLKINSVRFENFDLIYQMVNLFFDKTNINYEKINLAVAEIFRNSETESYLNESYTNIFNTQFYYNCIYSIYTTGVLFDNSNSINTTTINNIFNLTLLYNEENQNITFYNKKSINVKRFQNYLTNNNITDAFKYFISLFNKLLLSYNFTTYSNYLELVNSINNYISNNFVFINNYLVPEIVFKQAINKILYYVDVFNKVNNSDISVLKTYPFTSSNLFSANNVSVIFFLYLSFLIQCLAIDADSFTPFPYSEVGLIFEYFLVSKYSVNIYTQCIDDLILIFSSKGQLINLDFSTLVTNKVVISTKNSNNYTQNLSVVEKIYLKPEVSIQDTEFKIFYSLLNENSNIYVFNENHPTTYYDNKFYHEYNNSLTAFIYDYNKVLYSLYNKSLVNKAISINILSDVSLQQEYNNLRETIYNNSIILVEKTFNNILLSANSGAYDEFYDNRNILIILLRLLRSFFFIPGDQYNYYYTMYFKRCIPINDNTYLPNILDKSRSNFIDTITQIVPYYTDYTNTNIVNSIYNEKDINRLIYYYCTENAIGLSKNQLKAAEYCKKHTLYTMVRLYKINNNGYKQYLENTTIYGDKEINQLFNYNNWLDSNTWTQNKVLNMILETLDTDPNLTTSYYYYYKAFNSFVYKNYSEIADFILDDGTPVIDYFLNTTNLDELHEFIYNLITLRDNFSPNNFYNSIISIRNLPEASTFLNIEMETLKKKIIVFLFFSYIVLTNISTLLIKYFDYDREIGLEYNIDGEIITFSLESVMSKPFTVDAIKYFIAETNVFDPDNINTTKIVIPENIANGYVLTYFYNVLKSTIDYKLHYFVLLRKYISTYKFVVGNSDIYTTETLVKKTDSTISNLVQRINIIYNNDLINQNDLNTMLTIHSMNLLDIQMESLIYDYDNIINNDSYPISEFIENNKLNYHDTDISNINLGYNIILGLLDYFRINYPGENEDTNLIIGNLRLGSKFVNDSLENFKGVTTNYQISLDLITYNSNKKDTNFAINDFLYENILSRINTIIFSSSIAFDTENLSVVAPNDYDLSVNNFNFGKIYINFYKKYYSYVYNYYNFNYNYTVINENLYEYYNRIINNGQALLVLQKNSVFHYKSLFNNIVYTWISKIFYSTNYQDSLSYLSTINRLIKLFKTYNFQFKLNGFGVSNVKNLSIQNEFNINTDFNNYTDIYIYLTSLYNYMLLSDLPEKNKSNFKFDLVDFFVQINLFENYNCYYSANIINYVFRLRIVIILIIKMVSLKLGYNFKINYSILNKICNEIVNNISNQNNINIFFKSFYSNTETIDQTQKPVPEIIVNTVNFNEFTKDFSSAVKEVIYYANSNSILTNLKNAYNKYLNKEYKSYEYSYFDYSIRSRTLLFDEFTALLGYYLKYYFNIYNIQTNNVIYKNIGNFLAQTFTFKENNVETKVDFSIIENIIYNTTDINDSFKDDDKFTELTRKISDIILLDYWNIIFYNNIGNQSNEDIDNQILFYNFYFVYLNYYNNLNLTLENIEQLESFNYPDYLNNAYKLQILYRLIIVITTCQAVNYYEYQDILSSILINCHKYIYNGNQINSLDLTTNPATFFDFINKNYFNENLIPNYYKNVENDSVLSIIKYGIDKFNNPYNNLDSFTIGIYNKYINELNYDTENEIGKLFINNTILNIINNYSSLLYKSVLAEDEPIVYMLNCVNYLVENLNANMDVVKNIFGGESQDINNMYITSKNLLQLFNGKVYQLDEKFITIFTVLFSQLKKIIGNEVIIIMFYYNCLIPWISTTGDQQIDVITNVLYKFVNLINTNIITYLEINNPNNLYNNKYSEKYIIDQNIILNKFFDGLNLILFNVWENYDYIKACNEFFNLLVKNYDIPDQKIIDQSIDFIIKTYNGNVDSNVKGVFATEKTLLNNLIYSKYIKNNKITTWKLLLGLIVDFNGSDIIKLVKSINDETFLTPQSDYIDYIETINEGLIDNYGILKIIDRIELNFDDQIIDFVNRDYYKIFVNLFTNLNLYPALAQMLGLNFDGTNQSYITNGIKKFIKKVNSKLFIIPLNFFFNKYNNSIPLIACMYTNIHFEIFFNSRNLFKNSYTITFLNDWNFQTALNMDFILLEREERKRICEKQIDNLIETHSFYNQTINLNTIFYDDSSDFLTVNFDFNINQVVKELVWDLEFYLNEYKLSPVNFKEGVNDPTINIYDSILNTKFYMDGARRDGVLNLQDKNYNGITKVLNQYKYHTRANLNNYNNYNVYSFGLEPEEFQPTGALNMNTFRLFTIQVILKKSIILDFIGKTNKLFDLNKLSLKINLTTFNYNFVRYQSGLSGLLFTS